MTTSEATDSSVYGLSIEPSEDKPERDLIGKVERTHSGNVVLRVGQELRAGKGWYQIAHVVLTPSEALALAEEIKQATGVTR